jgi:hypothetical protein
MNSNRPHSKRPVTVLLVLAGFLAALVAPSSGGAYGWPVKPFHEQHPVRGMFGDPRLAGRETNFHFGVDVWAPNGTPVYATLTGAVIVDPANPQVVYVRSVANRSILFAYWHIVPLVHDGQFAVAYSTVIGRVASPWEHVHFAEHLNGRYVNPLRRGAMAPFVDGTRPEVRTFSVERDGTAVGRRGIRGRFDLVAEVADETPVAVPGRWRGRPVMPALVRWRMRGAHSSWAGWRVAADFRLTIPANDRFHETYARWTRQNKAGKNGRYRLVLARNWASDELGHGLYQVEIAATDECGNTCVRGFMFSIAGPPERATGR